MALTAFASPTDLAAWLSNDTAPANATQLLRSATFLVARAVNVDPFGDITVADALKDATLAQAAAWVALDLDPASLGVGSAPVKRSSIGSGAVERDTTGIAEAKREAATQLCPEAVAILTAAGLFWGAVPVGADECDGLPFYGLPIPPSGGSLLEWLWS